MPRKCREGRRELDAALAVQRRTKPRPRLDWAADVLRALIEEVDADPQLAQAIRDRLRAVEK
jgi:hypothetical protein